MSKASKARQAEKRRKAKSTAKAAARAQYAAWRDQGINQKSKRAKLRAKRANKVRTVNHATGRCYNHGCARCQPELNSPLNALHTSCIYAKQFTSPKWKNAA